MLTAVLVILLVLVVIAAIATMFGDGIWPRDDQKPVLSWYPGMPQEDWKALQNPNPRRRRNWRPFGW